MEISLLWAARLCSKQKRNYFENSIFAESMTWRTRFRDTQQDSLSYARKNERTLQKSTERLAGEAGGGGGSSPATATATKDSPAHMEQQIRLILVLCISPTPFRHVAIARTLPPAPSNSTKSSSYCPLSVTPRQTHPFMFLWTLPPHLVHEHIAPSRCESENRFSGPGSGRHFNDFNEPRAIHPHILSSRNRTFRYDVCITGGLTSRTVCFTHTKKRDYYIFGGKYQNSRPSGDFFCDYIFVYLLFNYSWKNGFGIFMFVEKLDYEFWFKLAAKCWMCVMNWCRYSISILAGHVFVAIWCLAEATKN